jgi:predicted transposase/invertase (TIGR01784 family)
MNGKFSRLDLNLKMKTKLVNVEIQISFDNSFRDRTLFYWAKLYTSELKSGDAYADLKQAIAINIIDFNMFEGNDYHTEIVTTIKGTNEIFSDKFGIHFFELKKVSRNINPNNRKELWMQFINADSEEDFNMIAEAKVDVIDKAVDVIKDMSEDTRIREMARHREKMLHDEASLMRSAREEGIAVGIAEGVSKGRAEERETWIANLARFGMSEEDIIKVMSMKKDGE